MRGNHKEYSLDSELECGLGYHLGIKLQTGELDLVRSVVKEKWLERIQQISPVYWKQFAETGIERYHELSHLLDHVTAWPKAVRILPYQIVEIIRSMSLIKKLEEIYGVFEISNEEKIEREEIYWRLVRPHQLTDVGPLHADAWFWDLGHGITPPDVKRVKVWVALHCEPGLNGLRVVPNSHKKEWKHHAEYRDDFIKPQIDENEDNLNPHLLNIDPGCAIVFHDKLLHGGVVNKGLYTRVSIEFTMFIKE